MTALFYTKKERKSVILLLKQKYKINREKGVLIMTRKFLEKNAILLGEINRYSFGYTGTDYYYYYNNHLWVHSYNNNQLIRVGKERETIIAIPDVEEDLKKYNLSAFEELGMNEEMYEKLKEVSANWKKTH